MYKLITQIVSMYVILLPPYYIVLFLHLLLICSWVVGLLEMGSAAWRTRGLHSSSSPNTPTGLQVVPDTPTHGRFTNHMVDSLPSQGRAPFMRLHCICIAIASMVRVISLAFNGTFEAFAFIISSTFTILVK